MKKLLLIDATNRKNSRTIQLALTYISLYKDYIVEHLKINNLNIKPLTGHNIEERSNYNEQHDFNHSIYDLAKQFKEADLIVIAAPYYDLSFPSILKIYIEHIICNNLTFKYVNGNYIGLCKANSLVYITTAGGYIGNENYGYDYIKAISKMLGIKETEFISAEGLDIKNNNPKEIIEEKIKEMRIRK